MCFYCKGKTIIPSFTTYVVVFENGVIVIKNVPCEECDQCGEKYYNDEVMEELEKIVDKAQSLASEVYVTDYNHRAA